MKSTKLLSHELLQLILITPMQYDETNDIDLCSANMDIAMKEPTVDY